MLLIPMRLQTHVGSDGPGFVDVLSSLCVEEDWQAPMRYVQWSVWPRAAPIWMEAVLLPSLPGKLFELQYARIASLQTLAGIFGSKGMTRAPSVDLPG